MNRIELKSAKVSAARHRPNKAFLEHTAEKRGYYLPSEKVALKGLVVKNTLQRVFNRTIGTDVILTNAECAKVNKILNDFIAGIDEILKKD
jgi:hypothetical protein